MSDEYSVNAEKIYEKKYSESLLYLPMFNY